MSLVGDLIMGMREAAVDLPNAVIQPPTITNLTITPTAGVTTIPAGTYYCYGTFRNPWGETTLGALNTVILAGGIRAISVAATLPVGITQVVIYFGLIQGAPDQYVIFDAATVNPGPGFIRALGTYATKPLRNTAYLPDFDGRALSVATVYRWINDGLKSAAVLCGGGIPDISGLQSQSGQPMYILQGNWRKIDDAWYDGYPIGLGAKGGVFRRSKTSGLSAALSVNHLSDRTIIEMYPQPPRTGGATTLNGDITSLATSLVVNANPFVLPMGLILIGTEIVGFGGFSGLTMTGLIRGLGGTTAQAWPSGTAITELNIMIAGLRVPTVYAVGSSYNTLNVPPGWETPLTKYLLSRFREPEQNGRDAQRLMQEFENALKNLLAANKPIAGPVQVTAGGRRGPEVAAGFGTSFGGVIIP